MHETTTTSTNENDSEKTLNKTNASHVIETPAAAADAVTTSAAVPMDTEVTTQQSGDGDDKEDDDGVNEETIKDEDVVMEEATAAKEENSAADAPADRDAANASASSALNIELEEMDTDEHADDEGSEKGGAGEDDKGEADKGAAAMPSADLAVAADSATTDEKKTDTTAIKATGDGNTSDRNESEASDTPKVAEDKREEEQKNEDNESSRPHTSDTTPPPTVAANGQKADAPAAPPPPIMRGTLSCDLDQRRHLIRGMWNYENSNVFPPQRFELVRNMDPGEDEKVLPKDGEFHGSFSLAYFHTTSKGKQKERSKVIPETGVNIKFTKVEGKDWDYKVDGKGTNQFGIFHINGTAKKSHLPGDPTLHVVLRKRYEPSEQPAAPVAGARAPGVGPGVPDGGPLPEPSRSFPTGVVSLRGKLVKEASHELGLDERVHKISGLWSSGLDFIVSDPENARGMCNRFEYEHKSSQPNQPFPVSGRYSGWFDLSNENGSRTRINERDITLKFRKNNAGFHNVEGKGSNVFGKYSITGTLTKDNIITIFRHFQPRKLKSKSATSTAGAPQSNAPGLARRPSAASLIVEPKLKLEDVKIPADQSGPITPPVNGTYSAVSRGVLRVNEDGSHSCQGKWAATREHLTTGQTSNFNFRLEAHYVKEALAELPDADSPSPFPLDSAMYKGSFQLKKQGGSRYSTIVDQQVVMKFRKNAQGAYNVHGKGINAIGEFNLLGTLIMSGKTGGQVEMYRMYPTEKLSKVTAPKPGADGFKKAGPSAGATAAATVPKLPGPPTGGLQRRESTRMVKLPSRLEDDDPSAQLSRVMDKCSQILRIIRERDVELGAFFSEPVDPLALGIPTYHQIIKEPMDLRTVTKRMEAGQITTSEEFSRLVRLVFENAITFNIDPAHSVHQAARNLLVLFNQKFRDVERMVQNIRLAHGDDWDEKEKKKGKDDKKRKRQNEEPKSLKRRRLEEAQAMASSNASAVAAIVAAAPATNSTTVTRTEFNMLLHLIQQLQNQVVQTHTALAELSPGNEGDAKAGPAASAAGPGGKTAVHSAPSAAPAPAQEKKKVTKRKSVTVEAPVPMVDDSKPLSLEEQELLTDTINELPPQHLGGVIQIIREAAPVGADEDEIDLEIDQLDTKTQRKLLRHVSKVRSLLVYRCISAAPENELIPVMQFGSSHVVCEETERKREEVGSQGSDSQEIKTCQGCPETQADNYYFHNNCNGDIVIFFLCV